MPVSRYVTLRAIKHSGTDFPIGSPMALSDDYAAPLLAIGAIQAQAGDLPAMPTIAGNVVRETLDTSTPGKKKRSFLEVTEGLDGGIIEFAATGKPIRFSSDLRTPNSLYGTTARIDLGSITIPPEVAIPGAYIKGWATFSGSKDALSKTHLISVNEAGGGMYGATDIFNAALTTSNYGGCRVEFYLRILTADTIIGGIYGSTTGLGATSSSVTSNPIVVPVNTRGGGLDIAFGGNVAAAPTAAVDVSNASPAVITHTAHGKFVGQLVSFAAAPAGLTSGRPYFIVSTPDANTYTVSETKGGDAIGTTASATGITATYYTVLTLEDAHIEVTL